MFAVSEGIPGSIIVCSGSVDAGLEDEVLAPKVEFFCKSKVGWMVPGRDVERRDTE